ncbi:hypothetical protein CAEBREN_03919 [Caenorhabditis brenneri]|uniref:Serpentine Receptor, class H n=1 Tax=Caenorhabditis brenneri TaxID=135651 RepID=G0M982_CAEBE|nr:hypothetical protein CAEBREN_03919 [Caenorhabditis brenneri]
MSASYLSTPEFLSITLHISSIFEFPVHLLGFYCILFKTPESMKSVRLTMLNLHFWSVFLDFNFSFLIRPFMLLPVSAVITLGVLEVPPVVQWHMAVTNFATVEMSIFSIFENRYYLLSAYNSWWRFIRYPVLVLNYLLAFTCFLPSLLHVPEQKLALESIGKKYPNIPITKYSDKIFVLTLDHSTLRLSLASVILSGVFETLTISFLLYRNMKKNVRNVNLSTTSYEIQRRFLRAVVIQIATPFLILIAPALYFTTSIKFSYYNQSINNLCITLISLHGFVSTIVMVLIHTPYRNFVMRKLKSNKTSPIIISGQSTIVQ